MLQKVFKWLDAHQLTKEQVEDYNYLETLLNNFEEEEGCEFDEDELVILIFDYQINFRRVHEA